MAMTLTAPPEPAEVALAVLAAAAEAPPTDPEPSLGARDGGDERTESLSGIELRGRIVGSFFMNASTCRRRSRAGGSEEGLG